MSAAEIVQNGAMTVDEATKFVGFGRTTLYALKAQGKIRTIKIGRRTLFPRSELLRVLAENLSEAGK